MLASAIYFDKSKSSDGQLKEEEEEEEEEEEDWSMSFPSFPAGTAMFFPISYIVVVVVVVVVGEPD